MPGRRTVRQRCVVLHKTKYAEQDVILTMIAEDGSQVRAVAKGARKPGSKLAARTDLFTCVDVLLSLGRGLPIVVEAQVMDTHASIRGDVEHVAAASALCEVARHTSYEDVVDSYLSAILQRALQAVEEAQDRAHLDLVVSAYAFKVLSHCGWMPALDGCMGCGEQVVTRFSVAAGGLLCESCSRDVAGAEPVSENHVGWLLALLGLTFDDLKGVQVDVVTSSWLLGMAHNWATTHLDMRLRALEFYADTAF